MYLPKESRQMARYYVKMRIDFAGEIEADTENQAEDLAWSSWGDTMDNPITYDGVYSIDVEKMEDDEEEDEDFEINEEREGIDE